MKYVVDWGTDPETIDKIKDAWAPDWQEVKDAEQAADPTMTKGKYARKKWLEHNTKVTSRLITRQAKEAVAEINLITTSEEQ